MNSRNYSSNIDTNNIFDNFNNHNNNRIQQDLEKEKSKTIKNLDKKIKQFAEYISKEKFKEIENNQIIKKLKDIYKIIF